MRVLPVCLQRKMFDLGVKLLPIPELYNMANAEFKHIVEGNRNDDWDMPRDYRELHDFISWCERSKHVC